MAKSIIEFIFLPGFNSKDLITLEKKEIEKIKLLNCICYVGFIMSFFLLLKSGYNSLPGIEITPFLYYLSIWFRILLFPLLLFITWFKKNSSIGGTFMLLYLYVSFLISLISFELPYSFILIMLLIPYFTIYMKGFKAGLKWSVSFVFFLIIILVLIKLKALPDLYPLNVLIFTSLGIVNLIVFHLLSEYYKEKYLDTINRQLQEITKISRTDELTGVMNRRAFFEALSAEMKRAMRAKWRLENADTKDSQTYNAKPAGTLYDHFGTFALLMIDIDYFKNINDNFSHLEGDMVLKEIGNILLSPEYFRSNDVRARFGGEEFIIMLPETNANNAKVLAERIRETIAGIKFNTKNGQLFHVTISIGISEFNAGDESFERLIRNADLALYEAKKQGRNRTIVYDENLD